MAASKPEPGVITDKRSIGAAQRTLNQLGYNAGKPDGIVGPDTRQAIRAFQRDRGLVEDGRLTLSLAGKLEAEIFIVVRAGDLLVYTDGETELVVVEREVQWNGGNTRSLVAIRPSMAGWPEAARAGLDWAISHALDTPGSSVKWSSTGVDQNFEIYASELTPGEAAIAGDDAQSCRRFEMRSNERQRAIPQSPAATGTGGGICYKAKSGLRDRQWSLGLLLHLMSNDLTGSFCSGRIDETSLVKLQDVRGAFSTNAVALFASHWGLSAVRGIGQTRQ